MLTPFKRGGLCTCLCSCLLLLSLCSFSFSQTTKSTCTMNSGKPCPEWLHKWIGQYPPLPTPEESRRARDARFFSLGDGESRLKPDRPSWAIFIGGHAAAWAATIVAVRRVRTSSEAADSEYPAMGALTGMDLLAFLTVCPAIGSAPPGYAIYHYTKAALK